MRLPRCRNGFRCARGDDLAAGVAAFRSQIDHVVGGLDHVEMVLDNENRVAGIHEPIQTFEQALDIGQVKSGRRFIQNVERVLRPLQLRKFGGDLDALRFAAGERRRRLTQREIAQARDRSSTSIFLPIAGSSAKNVTPSSTDILRMSLMVLPRSVTSSVSATEARALAGAAGHFDVGHEVELRGDDAFALALLATAALDVEAETARLCIRALSTAASARKVANRVVEADVGRGVRAAVAADRRLVDVDDLVDVLRRRRCRRVRRAACAYLPGASTEPCTGSR